MFLQYVEKTSVLNTIIHTTKYTCCIFSSFTHLRTCRSKISDVCTLIMCGNFECATCSSGIFFKKKRDIFIFSIGFSVPIYLARFKSSESVNKNSTSCREKSNKVKSFCYVNFSSITTPCE